MQTIRVENQTILRVLLWIAAFMVAVKLVLLLQTPLIWIGAAFFLTVALNPAVSFLARYLPRRSRGTAIMAVLTTFFLLVGFLILSFVPPLVSQTQALVNNIPGSVQKIQHIQGPIGELAVKYDLSQRLSNISSVFFNGVAGATGSALDVVKNLFNGIAAILTIFTLTFFMLLEAPRWLEMFWALVPKHRRTSGMHLAREMYRAVTGYVNGNFFTSAIAAVSSAIVMILVGVPYAIPLGLMVGLLDLIPLVGATLAAVVVILIALFTSVTAAIVLAVFFVVYQQIENNILQPLVYGKSTELSPLVVTIAILFGTVIAGIFGALVAIPVAACIKVVLMYKLQDRLTAAETPRSAKKAAA